MFQKSIYATALAFAAALGLSMSIENTWADSTSTRAAASDTANEQSVIPGQIAPDFKLRSESGQEVSPKDFRGHWVVLYFYPKDFTKGCTIEAHNFQRDSAQYAAADAVILGVSIGTPESHKEFCAKEGLSFKLLADTAGKVSNLYGSLKNWLGYKMSARNTFLINPDGKVVRMFIGVKPADHSEEVLAALKELQKT